MRLPLGLSVVRRLDLSGQAMYFVIPFKGTSKKSNNKTNKTTSVSKRIKEDEERKERKKERKKENDHVELNPNLRERCAQTGNIDIISITRHNNTSYRKALSNKKQMQ